MFAKPLPGTGRLERQSRKAEAKAHERAEMDAAKLRDHKKCRFPRCRLKLRIDACHEVTEHRGMGGNPDGTRTERKKCISFCALHHKLYDLKRIKVEPLDAEKHFDGPCIFSIEEEESRKWVSIGQETIIGVSVMRGA